MKHEPIRTCLGCRARDARSNLVRVVAHAGSLVVDETGRLGGRGGYFHADRACVDTFTRRGGFVRSLGCVVPKPERETFRARFPEVHA
ncbi:MAG: hypothetical protein B6D46_16260 [Polyangiaceae bacterium UTPRO1]|nr:MAG: hypothetical protein B6D46_16260 [Polyangiaceae bacterium UTPRO1]